MIIDVTTALLDNDLSLSHREARTLVECAERAIGDLLPSWRDCFNSEVRPQLEGIIQRRWPFRAPMTMPGSELVN